MVNLAELDIKSKKVKHIKKLSQEELDDLNVQCEKLYIFEKRTHKFQVFKNTFSDITNLLDSTESLIKYNRLIMELMSSFRALLDHWETQIKRDFGKESEEIENFKNATHEAYDKYFSYRFCSGFRNYLQHLDMPALRVESKLRNDNSIETKIFISKTEILSNFDGWKSIVRKDLSNKPEQIELMGHFKELYEIIRKINHLAINLYDIIDLLNASEKLMTLSIMKSDTNNELILFRLKNIENEPININRLPENIAKFVLENVSVNK